MSLLLDNPELLVGYRNGDRFAFEAIYRQYVNEVATLVRRGFTLTRPKVVTVAGVADSSSQCDLIQDVFVRAFSETARLGYDGKLPYRPYLLRIAKNLMIDRLRKKTRGFSESSLNVPEGLENVDSLLEKNTPFLEPDPGEQAHLGRQQRATREYVRTASESERTFFNLRYQKGLAQEVVAGRLEITRRKVRTLESRLRRGLKRYLQNSGLWP